MLLPNLDDLLEYKNSLVIKRFRRNYPAWEHKAEDLFTSLLKYLWLCCKHDEDKKNSKDQSLQQFSCVMHREMRPIDEMWHTFILITQDYADFCQRYFGTFLHHIPEVGGEAENAEKLDEIKFEKQLRLFLSYTYDHLGETTVRDWFSDYVS